MWGSPSPLGLSWPSPDPPQTCLPPGVSTVVCIWLTTTQWYCVVWFVYMPPLHYHSGSSLSTRTVSSYLSIPRTYSNIWHDGWTVDAYWMGEQMNEWMNKWMNYMDQPYLILWLLCLLLFTYNQYLVLKGNGFWKWKDRVLFMSKLDISLSNKNT